MSKVQIKGGMVRDFDLRYTAKGIPVASSAVAENERWSDKTTGEERRKTRFFDVEMWGSLAEQMAEKATKGKFVDIEGYLEQEKWQDKDGRTRSKVKIVARKLAVVEFAPKRASAGVFTPPPASNPDEALATGTDGSTAAPAAAAYEVTPDDGIPF
jgi:single-strand DNA-binding protein